MESNLKERRRKFPASSASAGCIFKNPSGNSAGLKGLRVGNAQVSEKHANFIINLGKAKQSDVSRLIELIQKKVFEQFKIRLEPEIKRWGV